MYVFARVCHTNRVKVANLRRIMRSHPTNFKRKKNPRPNQDCVADVRHVQQKPIDRQPISNKQQNPPLNYQPMPKRGQTADSHVATLGVHCDLIDKNRKRIAKVAVTDLAHHVSTRHLSCVCVYVCV